MIAWIAHRPRRARRTTVARAGRRRCRGRARRAGLGGGAGAGPRDRDPAAYREPITRLPRPRRRRTLGARGHRRGIRVEAAGSLAERRARPDAADAGDRCQDGVRDVYEGRERQCRREVPEDAGREIRGPWRSRPTMPAKAGAPLRWSSAVPRDAGLRTTCAVARRPRRRRRTSRRGRPPRLLTSLISVGDRDGHPQGQRATQVVGRLGRRPRTGHGRLVYSRPCGRVVIS